MRRRGGRYATIAGTWWRNPKIAKLSAEARSLYCAGLSYCADQMSDGAIPKYIVPALLFGNPAANPVAELLGSSPGSQPLWRDAGDAFQVHDFAEHNITRAEAEAAAEKARENGKRGGRRKQSDDEAEPGRLPSREPSRLTDPGPRTQDIKTSSHQDPHTRARATPEAVLVPLSGTEVQRQTRTLELVDSAWESVTGVALGVEISPGPKQLRAADAIARWARKHDPGGWEAAITTIATNAARGMGDDVRSPLLVLAESPGRWLKPRKAAAAKGPAPPRKSEEFTHDDPDEFWDRVDREHAAEQEAKRAAGG
jgi:hypothetical protein